MLLNNVHMDVTLGLRYAGNQIIGFKCSDVRDENSDRKLDYMVSTSILKYIIGIGNYLLRHTLIRYQMSAFIQVRQMTHPVFKHTILYIMYSTSHVSLCHPFCHSSA